MNSTQGSYQYFTPEMLLRKNDKGRENIRGESSDIWALGITFY